jgi:ribose 5-phosphate isomerase B
MRIVIGADHAGVELKQWLLTQLAGVAEKITDVGTHDTSPVDYPDIARAVGRAVSSGQADRGIILCGSGIGAAMAANKMKGILAGTCHDTYSAHQGVEHDRMNVLCLGARVIGPSLALEIVRAFLGAEFSAEERHARRVGKILQIERDGG